MGPTAAAHGLPLGERVSAQRPSWSAYVYLVGVAAMATAIVLVVAGVPARTFYDVDGPGRQNETTSSDMLTLSRSIDENIKYLESATGDGKDEYNGLESSILARLEPLPRIAASSERLSKSVRKMEHSMASMQEKSAAMHTSMAALGTTSSDSAKTFEEITAEIGALAESMSAMLAASRELVDSMEAVEADVRRIAKTRTPEARRITAQINAALPPGVPAANTSVMPDRGVQ
jgi:methyl-accepting chemotaxis protein